MILLSGEIVETAHEGERQGVEGRLIPTIFGREGVGESALNDERGDRWGKERD